MPSALELLTINAAKHKLTPLDSATLVYNFTRDSERKKYPWIFDGELDHSNHVWLQGKIEKYMNEHHNKQPALANNDGWDIW